MDEGAASTCGSKVVHDTPPQEQDPWMRCDPKELLMSSNKEYKETGRTCVGTTRVCTLQDDSTK